MANDAVVNTTAALPGVPNAAAALPGRLMPPVTVANFVTARFPVALTSVAETFPVTTTFFDTATFPLALISVVDTFPAIVTELVTPTEDALAFVAVTFPFCAVTFGTYADFPTSAFGAVGRIVSGAEIASGRGSDPVPAVRYVYA